MVTGIKSQAVRFLKEDDDSDFLLELTEQLSRLKVSKYVAHLNQKQASMTRRIQVNNVASGEKKNNVDEKGTKKRRSKDTTEALRRSNKRRKHSVFCGPSVPASMLSTARAPDDDVHCYSKQLTSHLVKIRQPIR